MGHTSGDMAIFTAWSTKQKRLQPMSARCASSSLLLAGVGVGGECMKSAVGKEKARER